MPTDRHVSASAVLEAARALLGVDNIEVHEDILRDAFVVRVRIPAVEHAVMIDGEALRDARFASSVVLHALQPLRDATRQVPQVPRTRSGITTAPHDWTPPPRRSGHDVARIAVAAEQALTERWPTMWEHLIEAD